MNTSRNTPTNDDAHERARQRIALAGSFSGDDPRSPDPWLEAHLQTCDPCRVFAENARQTILALRAIPIAAGQSLVSTTQMRVRQRALELRRQRERLWLVSVSCTAVTVCALVSALALWRGFAWVGSLAGLQPLLWQAGFVVFCITPSLVAGVVLLSRGTYLADHTGSYRG